MLTKEQNRNDPFFSSPSQTKRDTQNPTSHLPVDDLSPLLDSDSEDLMVKITDLSLDELLVDSPFLPKHGRSRNLAAQEYSPPDIRARTPSDTDADEWTKDGCSVEKDPAEWEDGEAAIERDYQMESLMKIHPERAEEVRAVRRAAEVVAAVGSMLQSARSNVQELTKTAEQTENLLGIWIHLLKQTFRTKEVLESPDFDGGTEDARKIRQLLEEKNNAMRIAQEEAEAAAIKAAEQQEIAAAAAALAAEAKAKTSKRTTSTGTKSLRSRGTSGKPPPKVTKGSRTRVAQVS